MRYLTVPTNDDFYYTTFVKIYMYTCESVRINKSSNVFSRARILSCVFVRLRVDIAIVK